jgi:protein-S-isoprenylcysteine O-methyltransferase Ste14
MGGADTEHGGPGLSDLMGELGREISTLFRQEVELAKAEVREQSKRAGAAAGKLVAAAVIGLVAALLLSWTLVYLIDLVAPEWVGFAIVGVVYAVVAAVLGANGRKQMQNVNPKPEQTAQTIQEDKGWLKNR